MKYLLFILCFLFSINALAETSIKPIHFTRLQSFDELPTRIKQGVEKIEKQHLNLLAQTKNNLGKLKLDKNLLTLQEKALDALIQKNHLGQKQNLNFLDMQLIDAISILLYIPERDKQVVSILKRMSYLAKEALSSRIPDSDRELLDLEYQELLALIEQGLPVPTRAGDIKIRGDLTIQIGKGQQASVFKVPVLDISNQYLGITMTGIKTSSDAEDAYSAVATAIDTVEAFIAIEIYLEDAEIMLASLPSILALEYELFEQTRTLSIQAANGLYSDYDRSNLDKFYLLLVANLIRTSSYLSLMNGTINLGGGDIHMQFGEEARGDNELTIHLPISSADSLGWNKLSIACLEDAQTTRDKIRQDISNFVYMK